MYRLFVPDAETRKAFDIISILKSRFPNVPMICGNSEGTDRMKRYLGRIYKAQVEMLRTTDVALCVEDFNSIVSSHPRNVLHVRE